MLLFSTRLRFHERRRWNKLEQVRSIGEGVRSLIETNLPSLEAEVNLVDNDYFITEGNVSYILYISDNIISLKNTTLKTEITISTDV